MGGCSEDEKKNYITKKRCQDKYTTLITEGQCPACPEQEECPACPEQEECPACPEQEECPACPKQEECPTCPAQPDMFIISNMRSLHFREITFKDASGNVIQPLSCNASSTLRSANVCSRSMDGDEGTYFHMNNYATPPHYVQYALPSDTTVASVDIVNMKGRFDNRLNGASLFYFKGGELKWQQTITETKPSYTFTVLEPFMFMRVSPQRRRLYLWIVLTLVFIYMYRNRQQFGF